jgi:hypothetical protein
MAISEIERRYFQEFGEKIPYQYFSSRKEALSVAEDALANNEELEREDWLREAGYTDAAIEEIKDGDLLI